MSKQFTIITKNGSKWLRPVNQFDENGQAWRGFQSSNPDLPYIGSRPEGTILDESEVTAITQARHKESSSLTWFNVYDNGNWDYHETRTVYRDVEPPDIDYEKEMPHKKWPSTKYVARKVDAESHDRHISDEVHPILAWLRTNGEISEDGKHVTYSCEEIEAFFNKPNWMRFKEVKK